jgi:hypothetical protein
MTFPSIEEAQQTFPNLNIEKSPVIFFFDDQGIAFKTYELNKAVEFIKSKSE